MREKHWSTYEEKRAMRISLWLHAIAAVALLVYLFWPR